jgi:NADH:ubiquinone oxidoreductase subunit 6 (subunit J)
MYEFLIMSLVLMYAAALFVFFLVVIGMACLLVGNTNIYKKYIRERRERLVDEFLKDLNK